MARDTCPEIRAAALRASAKLGHPGSKEWILAALRDPDSNVRVQSINTCAALGLREAQGALIELLDDPELWVSLRAEQALEAFQFGVDDTAGSRSVA
ncbi:HEAT repeat domain-containing protein [Citromicrobium bathyomarinum]|uniref:HEAT repeat domain-containing protein n=1 Tax=Citromicrobium bathyomarinum TaxID=72174 RepID=UPI00315A4B43